MDPHIMLTTLADGALVALGLAIIALLALGMALSAVLDHIKVPD